jgi:TPR repeat protein
MRAKVTAVRHEVAGDHVRVVVHLDRVVRFVDGTATDPYRVFFDLQNTRPADTLASHTLGGNGVLRRIRVAQYQPGITRVVLDLDGPAAYSSSFQANPPQLVVEISRTPAVHQALVVASPGLGAAIKANTGSMGPTPARSPQLAAAPGLSSGPLQSDERKAPMAVVTPPTSSVPFAVQKQVLSGAIAPSDSKLVSHFGPAVDGDPSHLLQAAQRGDRDAQFRMGDIYMSGHGVVRDPAAAATWYRAAAQQGHAVAASNLGVLYANGWGVKQNDTEAVNWFRKAADAGDAGGRNNLGSMYIAGRGVPQSDSIGTKLVLLAAQQGVPEAQYALGTLYINGRGVPRDEAEAAKWLKPAATQGYAAAQVALGKMYTVGAGVGRDYAEAYAWYALAAASGDKESLAAMNSLAARMSAGQLAQAQQRALAIVKPRQYR